MVLVAGGLFSPKPHLCLIENFWYQEKHVATTRYFIIDAETNNVTLHASSMVAYTRENLEQITREVGFKDIAFYESLSGEKRILIKTLKLLKLENKPLIIGRARSIYKI